MLGRRATRALEFDSPLSALAIQTGMGLGIVSAVTLALGLAGLLHSVGLWLLLVLGILARRHDARSVLTSLRSIRMPATSGLERALRLFCAITLSIAFAFAILPPMGYDSQLYHLVIAKHALDIGRISVPPDNLTFSFPSLIEMLFLAGMVLKGDGTAQLIHFAYLLLVVGLLFALARRYFTTTVAWLACAVLLLSPRLCRCQRTPMSTPGSRSTRSRRSMRC